MRFTTPCFIRKNTEELRSKLEDLGYNLAYGRCIDCSCLATSAFHGLYMSISEEMYDSTNPHITYNCANRKDCGVNEELFLAIAALRDDTDKFQWFTDGYHWEKCPDDKADIVAWESKYKTYPHKANPEEIRKRFFSKKKR